MIYDIDKLKKFMKDLMSSINYFDEFIVIHGFFFAYALKYICQILFGIYYNK